MASDLVPGDIMLIEEGDKISADARLIDSTDLQVNQSALTGESNPIRKNSIPIDEITLILKITLIRNSTTNQRRTWALSLKFFFCFFKLGNNLVKASTPVRVSSDDCRPRG